MSWLSHLEKDYAVKKLFAHRRLMTSTQIAYLKGINDFCQFFNASPSEIVKRFKAMSDDEILEVFREYFAARKDSLAPKTLKEYTNAIRALLVENGVRNIDLLRGEINRELRRAMGKYRKILKADLLTKEEIARLLRAADPRMKALISLMATSGIRIGAAVRLQLKHIKDDIWDTSLPCYMIEVPQELSKEKEPYITFITWEAGEYLRDWLNLRKNQGEILTLESYLFPGKLEGHLSRSRAEALFRELCFEVGLDMRPVSIKGKLTAPRKGNRGRKEIPSVRYNVRPHGLRKFFRTALAIAGVDRLVAEALMGHSLSVFGVESIYNFAASRIDYVREQYMKSINHLLILRKPRGLEIINGEARKRIEELEAELKRRDEELEKLRKDVKELSILIAPMALAINALAKAGNVKLRGLLKEMSHETDKVLRELMRRRVERGELSEEEAKRIIEAFGAPNKTKKRKAKKTKS